MRSPQLPKTAFLPIGLTPNDPRGSVRICPVSRRRAMTPIVVPATSACSCQDVFTFRFDHRRTPDREIGLVNEGVETLSRDRIQAHQVPP